MIKLVKIAALVIAVGFAAPTFARPGGGGFSGGHVGGGESHTRGGGSFGAGNESPRRQAPPEYRTPMRNSQPAPSRTPDADRAVTFHPAPSRPSTPPARQEPSRNYGNQYGQGTVSKDKSGNTQHDFKNTNSGTVTHTGTDNKGRQEVTHENKNGTSDRTVDNRGNRGGTTKTTYDKNGRVTGETTTQRQANGRMGRTKITMNPKTGERTTVHSNGNVTVKRGDGSSIETRRNGEKVTIERNGTRTVERGGRVVSRDQYVVRNNTRIRERITIVNNRYYVHNYNTYYYGGYAFYSYTPFYWYPTYYYTYLYVPWNAPFYYTWDPYLDSWYYRPYVSYCGPVCWLTDYIILENLRAEEAADAAAAAEMAAASARPDDGYPVTDQTRDQIRSQVDDAVRANERKESIELVDALKNPKYIYTANVDVDVALDQSVNGDNTCTINQGDMLKVTEQRQGAVVAEVVATRGDGCDLGSKVIVTLDNLQDMMNAFTEKLDRGMETMNSQSSKFPGHLQSSTPTVNGQEVQSMPTN